MLVEFLVRTSKINNELEKLNHFTNRKLDYSKDIEENIDSVKTVFELRKAIGERNQLKVHHC
jgi:hypothetical protein